MDSETICIADPAKSIPIAAAPRLTQKQHIAFSAPYVAAHFMQNWDAEDRRIVAILRNAHRPI